jgi:hypothetical protein
MTVIYLKIVVFVKSSSSEQRNKTQRSHIHILTGKEKECHRAAMGHTILGQRFTDICLGLEKYLKMQERKKERSQTIFDLKFVSIELLLKI